MAYVQHTQCIDLGKYKPLKYKAQPAIEMLVLFGGTLAWIAALLPVVLGSPFCALHAIPLMAYGGVFGYCNWWLFYRLVCLGGDRAAIGALVSYETPESKTGFWDKYDTDYSVNLLLYGLQMNATHVPTQAEAEASVPFGKLVAPTDPVKARSDIVFTGEFAAPDDFPKDKNGHDQKAAILHAEFEGSGVWILFLASAASLMLVVAAIFLCMVPGWGWVASWVLEALAFLALLFGHAAARSDGGSPTDVNPDLGALHPVQGGDLTVLADVLYVQGTWVFDGGHQDTSTGWNEIHPIKNALVVGHWNGDWSTAVDSRYVSLLEHAGRIAEALSAAQTTSTQTSQRQPENQWLWHPLVDGCEPHSGPPPIK